MKAVTIFHPPYIIERIDLYDQYLDICTLGFKCKRPSYKNGTIKYKQTCCTGFVIDVFLNIMKYTGIKADLYVAADNNYGGKGSNGNWNGVIGKIVNGEADIAITTLSVTKDRLEVVNFTEFILKETVAILLTSQKASGGTFRIYSTFITPELIITLILGVLGTTMIFYSCENSIYLTNHSMNKICYKEKYYTMYEAMTYIVGVVLQRDLGGINPRKLGTRVVAIFFAFAMVVFITSCTAVLTTDSIKQTEENPFLGLKDSRVYFIILHYALH